MATVKFNQDAVDDGKALDGFYIIESNLAGLDWYDDKNHLKRDKPVDGVKIGVCYN